MSDQPQRRRTRSRGRKKGARGDGGRNGGGRGGGRGGGDQGGGGRSRQSRGTTRRRRDDPTSFWGKGDELPEPQSDVRMTTDPHAVPRSLGPPPLPGHERMAEYYFAAVYDRAVQTAGALAAAGGLIDPDRLTDEG